MTATWEASFGDLDFSPAAQHGEVTVEVHGLQRGKHTRITAVADSLIQDGSIERVVRDDNRDVQLVLCLDGTDSDALAQYEATLFREVNRGRNEFRWTPPDGFGATAVFDVLWADLAFADEGNVWDLDEIRGRRNYVLTLRCLPFARSVDPFTVSGVTSGATPTTVVINDATAVTGWTEQPPSGSVRPAQQSGTDVFVDVVTGYYPTHPVLIYTPASPVDMTSTQYLHVYWRTTSVFYTNENMPVTADGTPLTQVERTYIGGYGDGPFGYHRTTYICPDASVSEFRITAPPMSGYAGGSSSGTFRIDKLERTNQAPSTGTLRQKSIRVEVPGSARAAASLEVSHPTSGLGDVLVYTGAAGYNPALSPFRVSTTTADSEMVSGERGVGGTYDIPAFLLRPGNYQLVTRATTEATYTATAVLRVGGVDVGTPTPGPTSALVTPYVGATYMLHTLGSFMLPPREVPTATSATVRVVITATGGGTKETDEAWLFYMPDDGSAHLSAIAAGTSKRMWLDAPTIDRPHPACYVGNAADRSDAYGVDGAVSNWDEHLFPAGSNEVFVVTTTALDAQVELEGWARWLTHPAA